MNDHDYFVHSFSSHRLASRVLTAIAAVSEWGGKTCFVIEKHVHIYMSNGEKSRSNTFYFVLVFKTEIFAKKQKKSGDDLSLPPSSEVLTAFVRGYLRAVKDAKRSSPEIVTHVHNREKLATE